MIGKIETLFRDFLSLGYVEGNNPWKDKVLDIPLGNLIVLRQSRKGLTVHYLYNGSTLFIPFRWHDLFQSFYIYSGDQILFLNEEKAFRPDLLPYKERMIWLNVELQSTIAKRGPGTRFLDILGDICSLRTESFRKMLKLNYNLDIEPFEFTSLRKEIRI